MERLTNFWGNLKKCAECAENSNCYSNQSCDHIANAIVELRDYEDLEEQGKLLKLPCAVGDTVYRITKEFHTGMKKIISGKVYRIALTDTEMQIFIDGWQSKGIFGKTVFLTKEEAEAALKEL